MTTSGRDVATYARQFQGQAYEWGNADIGLVADFRRALEAGGTIDEIYARVDAIFQADFERSYQAFCAERLMWPGMHVY